MFLAFICCTNHAIYKCREELWQMGTGGEGYVYSCLPADEEAEVIETDPIRPIGDRQIGYQLVDFDDEYLALFPCEVDSLSAEMMKRCRLQYHMAEGEKGYLARRQRTLPDDRQIEILKLPSHYAKAPSDKRPEADLFYNWAVGSPYDLRDPAAVHIFLLGYDLEEASSLLEDEEVSSTYLYNPHIRYLD